MTRLVAFLVCLLAWAAPALAQSNPSVVTKCGTVPSGIWTPGSTAPATVDQNGNLCGNSSGGSSSGVTTTGAGFTISAGGAFQSIAAASSTRKGCLIQNTSAHTMYVFFGATVSATTSNSIQIAPGGWLSCIAGTTVLQDNIAVSTSTTSDTGVLNLN